MPHGEGVINLAKDINAGLLSSFPQFSQFPEVGGYVWKARVCIKGGEKEAGLAYVCSEFSFVGSQLLDSEIPVLSFPTFKLLLDLDEKPNEIGDGIMVEFHTFT